MQIQTPWRRVHADAAPLIATDGSAYFGVDPTDPEQPPILFVTPKGTPAFGIRFDGDEAYLVTYDEAGVWHRNSVHLPTVLATAHSQEAS
jgi:hypothetical protein